MTISGKSVCFSSVGPKSRSKRLFYEKKKKKKTCHGFSAFIYKLIFINFTQMLVMTISGTSSHFRFVCPRSKSQFHMAGAFTNFSNCVFVQT